MLHSQVNPIAYLVAGLLKDQVFGPAMRAGGALAPIFGPLIGTGPGAGIALMFFFTGILGTSMAICGYLWSTPAPRGGGLAGLFAHTGGGGRNWTIDNTEVIYSGASNGGRVRNCKQST